MGPGPGPPTGAAAPPTRPRRSPTRGTARLVEPDDVGPRPVVSARPTGRGAPAPPRKRTGRRRRPRAQRGGRMAGVDAGGAGPGARPGWARGREIPGLRGGRNPPSTIWGPRPGGRRRVRARMRRRISAVVEGVDHVGELAVDDPALELERGGELQ